MITDREMLDQQGAVVLPDEMNHEAFKMVLAAAMLRPDKPIALYCRGDGGDSTAALAIVDIMQRHGQFVGILPGEANSGHATVWAACSSRYVYPGGSIGVHRCARSNIQHINAPYARRLDQEMARIDIKTAHLLAEACTDQTYGEAYWYEVIDGVGSHGVAFYDADFLIRVGMALPIAAWKVKGES